MSAGANERPYLSIGEVLGLLLEEFPDITISKIRFLESQGLIEPERTASGYRKFYDADVERLRVILREQRENFLPLRVIRDRLETGAIDDSGGLAQPPRGIRNVRLPMPTGEPVGTLVDDDLDDTSGFEIEIDPTGTISVHAEHVTTSRHPAARAASAGVGAPTAQVAVVPAPAAEPAPSAASGRPVVPVSARSVPAPPAVAPVPAGPVPTERPTQAVVAELIEAPTFPSPAAPGPTSSAAAAPAADAGRHDVYLRSELCAAAGLTAAQLAELESYGLLTGRGSGSGTTYGESDVTIARAAAGFLARGVDARHLRAWRQSAEREAGLFEQRILPLLRQRNPQARHDAVELLNELATLGGELRDAIVHAALRHHLES